MMKIKVGVSVRHVHLTKDIYEKLFGTDKLEKLRDLDQPGQFASTSTVTIKNGERQLDNVRIVGPLREYNQVEISRTDSYFLKINPPLRNSGDLEDSESITIVGPNGEVTLSQGLIMSNRHIHLTLEDVKRYKLENVEKVCVRVDGEKAGIIKNVFLKVLDTASLSLHLDTDDANALDLKTGDEVEVLLEK